MQFKIPKFGFKFKKRGNAAGFFGAKLSIISNHLSIINDKLFQNNHLSIISNKLSQNNHLSIINDKLSKKRINYKLSIFGKKLIINYKLLIAVGVLALAATGGTLALNGFFGGGAAIPEDTMTRGLVGYWSFDEGDGAIARDASGNNNHGTLTNGPKWTQGKSGGALQFDGKDDYVDAGNGSSLNITDSITLEAWVFMDYTGSKNSDLGFIAKESSYLLYDTWGELRVMSAFWIDGAWRHSTSTGVNSNQWYHLVTTYSSLDRTIRFYIDGNEVAPVVLSGLSAYSLNISANNVHLGNGTLGKKNRVDEARIYNRVLTAEEVRYHYNHGGPVAYWDMDEGSGLKINDKSGNGNDGTLVNGATWAQGKHGSALSFDGVDDYASVANSASLNPTSKITVGLWAKRNGAGTGVTPGLLSKRANGFGLIWQVGADTERLSTRIYQSNGTAIDSGVIEGVLSVGEWRYINLVADGTNVITYVDGVPKKTVPYNGTILTGTALLTIGQQSNAYFNGQIDEVKIYDYARTEEEIRLDYNAGLATHLGSSGKTCSEDPAGCMDFGLAGHWDMDEGSGSVINDKSGNNNHGTLTNGPQWTQGKNGGALQFDGKDDYVDVGNNSVLNFTNTSAFSAEAWVYLTRSSGRHKGIMGKGSGSASQQYWGLYYKTDSKEWRAILYDGSIYSIVSSSDSQPTNKWIHLLMTYDGVNNLKFYINGNYIGQSVATLGDFSHINTAKIGTIWNTFSFPGIIDEARIYNRALTEAEVKYHYNHGGPVAQWDMDEGSGSVINDKSGNGNDGTISGATWAQGKHGSALSFDGVDDYAETTSFPSLRSNDFTMSAWINTNAPSVTQGIISDGSGTGSTYYSIRVHNGVIVFSTWDGASRELIGIKSIEAGTWYHITVVWDKDMKKSIYVNGLLDASTEEYTSITGDVSGLRIGKHSYSYPQYFDGQIDEVKIYDYARTEEEIRLDYNAGLATHLGPSGKTCSEDPAGCMDFGLAGHWDMDEGNGSMINDKSGNNNHGTLTNGPKWTKGKSGTALQFDGKDDYVDCGSDASLNIYDALSIEAWVRPDANKRADVVSRYYYSGATNNGGYSLRFWDDGKFYLVTLNDSQAGISANGVVGKWNHVIATYDVNGGANNLKIYINGTLAGQTTKANALKSITQNFKIGGFSYYHDGLVDGVKIYNRALSAEEVRYHYNQGKPVGYWAMDEGEGTRAFDVSGNNNTGVLTNGPTWVEGKHGSALSFDGVDDYVGCGTDSSLNIADSMTASAWIYPKTLGEGSAGHIVGRGGTSGWCLYVYTGNSLKLYAGTIQAVSSANSITLNQWQYATVVYDKQNVRFFVNGVEKGVTAATSSIVNTGSCVIGARTTAGDFDFNGYLDEVKVYNYARTAEQIMQDYNAGVATHLK